MRDLMALGAFLIMLGVGTRNAFLAYLLWGWAGLIALDTYLYGFMQNVTYVQIFALICLAQILMKRDDELIKLSLDRTVVLIIIFSIHALLSATFAAPGVARNWELFSNLIKTFLFCLLMPMMVTSRFRIHALIVVIALAISFHGGLDGLKFLASGGAHSARGNAKLGDNNHFAMTVLMVTPLLLYLYNYTERKLIRWGFMMALIVTALAVVATGSRGGLLSMVALAVWVILKSSRKVMGLFVVAFVMILIVQTAPESWSNRMNTINDASADTSFMGRVTAWKRASAIAVENPILGGGFHAGQAPSLFQQYRYKQGLLGFIDTPDVGYPAASHSIYFEVMGDLGFVGLFFFLLIIGNAFITRLKIKKLTKRNEHVSLVWASDLSDMLAGSLIVYIIGGALLSAAYFDLPYILMMLMEVLKQQVKRDITEANLALPIKA